MHASFTIYSIRTCHSKHCICSKHSVGTEFQTCAQSNIAGFICSVKMALVNILANPIMFLWSILFKEQLERNLLLVDVLNRRGRALDNSFRNAVLYTAIPLPIEDCGWKTDARTGGTTLSYMLKGETISEGHNTHSWIYAPEKNHDVITAGKRTQYAQKVTGADGNLIECFAWIIVSNIVKWIIRGLHLTIFQAD